MKLNIILLASGAGSRFGRNKLLHYVDGYPMYMHSVLAALKLKEGAAESCIGDVVVVTRYETIAESLLSYPVKVLWNSESFKGITSSIHIGIQASEGVDGYMFMVCDQPYLQSASLKGMLSAYMKGTAGIASMSYQGITGNPCIFDRKYREELLELEGDKGGKVIIGRHSEDVLLYEVEQKTELLDIDHEQEYSLKVK